MPSCGRFPSVITSIFRRYGIPPSLPSFTRAPNIAANPARIIWPTDCAARTHSRNCRDGAAGAGCRVAHWPPPLSDLFPHPPHPSPSHSFVDKKWLPEYAASPSCRTFPFVARRQLSRPSLSQFFHVSRYCSLERWGGTRARPWANCHCILAPHQAPVRSVFSSRIS